MSCGASSKGGGGHPQMMVDQGPKYDMRRGRRRKNQAMGRGGIIRPDKRYKAKYL